MAKHQGLGHPTVATGSGRASKKATSRTRCRMARAESRWGDEKKNALSQFEIDVAWCVERGGAESVGDPRDQVAGRVSPASSMSVTHHRVKRRPFRWHRLTVSWKVRFGFSYSAKFLVPCGGHNARSNRKIPDSRNHLLRTENHDWLDAGDNMFFCVPSLRHESCWNTPIDPSRAHCWITQSMTAPFDGMR